MVTVYRYFYSVYISYCCVNIFSYISRSNHPMQLWCKEIILQLRSFIVVISFVCKLIRCSILWRLKRTTNCWSWWWSHSRQPSLLWLCNYYKCYFGFHSYSYVFAKLHHQKNESRFADLMWRCKYHSIHSDSNSFASTVGNVKRCNSLKHSGSAYRQQR